MSQIQTQIQTVMKKIELNFCSNNYNKGIENTNKCYDKRRLNGKSEMKHN